MVVRLVAHGDLFLPDFASELAVHSHPHPSGGRLTLLLEDAAHVVEERGGGGEDGSVHPVQKKLCVLVALFSGQLQPVGGLPLILGDILPQQIRFT